MKPLAAVHERRARLVERAEGERHALADQLGAWKTPLVVVDRGLAIVRGVKRTAPLLGFGAGVAMAALAFVRPDSIAGWLSAGKDLLSVLTRRKPASPPPREPVEETSAEAGAK